MGNNLYDMNSLNLDDLANVTGGRDWTDADTKSVNDLLNRIIEAHAKLDAAGKSDLCTPMTDELAETLESWRQAIENTPEGGAAPDLAAMCKPVFDKYL